MTDQQIPSDEPLVIDATPTLNPDDFDIDAWIGGVEPTTRAVKLYSKAHLIAQVDDLTARLRIAEASSDADRGMHEESPGAIRQQLQAVAEEFEASGRWFKVAARSDERVQAIKDAARAKDKDITDHDVELHVLADAIVEPVGITVAHLRKIAETSEIQVKLLGVAAAQANHQPPRVDVPFSSKPSGGRGRRE